MELLSKVVLDSSMLLVVERFKIDVFAEVKGMLGNVEFFITKPVEKELEGLEKSHGKEVKIARELMEKNGVKVLESGEENADESLVEKGKEGMLIATNDGELRQKIKAFGGKVIYLKQKKMIEID